VIPKRTGTAHQLAQYLAALQEVATLATMASVEPKMVQPAQGPYSEIAARDLATAEAATITAAPTTAILHTALAVLARPQQQRPGLQLLLLLLLLRRPHSQVLPSLRMVSVASKVERPAQAQCGERAAPSGVIAATETITVKTATVPSAAHARLN
jgi:hypothetical protein